jgi:oxygen-independent coproporphyrinogen-3 oxidase
MAPIVSAEPRAAYVHVPFCARRCGYCNFTVVAGRDDLIGAYLEALQRELSWLGAPRPVETLFLGGGTPTHLPPAALDRLLELVARWFPLLPGGEWTIEANPADLSPARLAVLRRYPIDRISLGAQSLDAQRLVLLERDHTPDDVRRAVHHARSIARSVSLDLIFACPGETLADWQRDLEAALRLQPDHLSCYGLTFERGTSFWSLRHRGALLEVDDETQRAMFEYAIDRLAESGYEQYEVSNYARAGHRCRHNENYWLAGPYYAAGPGAARYIGNCRETNHRSTTTYLRRVLGGQSPVAHRELLSPQEQAREALVLGLRRLDGVRRAAFQQRFGISVDQLAGEPLRRFAAWGLLHDDGPSIRLTRDGLLVSDSLWPDLLYPQPATTLPPPSA